MAIRTKSEVIKVYKKCCHLTVHTGRGVWIYSDPNEWYDSIMKWLNYRILPEDEILSVTLSNFKDINYAYLISDMSIIREDLIATEICDLFIIPSTIAMRRPKTVWGGNSFQEECAIEDRRSIWNTGIWASTGSLQIDLSEYGGSYKFVPWRRNEYWSSIPPRQRMACGHRPIAPEVYIDDEEDELRRSKRLCK